MTLTTDRREASRGLFAKAELLVQKHGTLSSRSQEAALASIDGQQVLLSVARDTTNILKSLTRPSSTHRPPTTNFSHRTHTETPLSDHHRTSRGPSRTKTGSGSRQVWPRRWPARPYLHRTILTSFLCPYRRPANGRGLRDQNSARAETASTGRDAIAQRTDHVSAAYRADIRRAPVKSNSAEKTDCPFLAHPLGHPRCPGY